MNFVFIFFPSQREKGNVWISATVAAGLLGRSASFVLFNAAPKLLCGARTKCHTDPRTGTSGTFPDFTN